LRATWEWRSSSPGEYRIFDADLAGRFDDGDQSGSHQGDRHKDNPRRDVAGR
jgi:hypothetical protein